jgi:hypothetical protein
MRPEPGSRPPRKRRRWPNEARPLTIRVGAIRDELDARSDGTEIGYRAVIMRDLKRYYRLLADNQPPAHDLNPEAIRDWFAAMSDDISPHANGIAILDALERAHVLVDHAGLTVDAALVVVGLVKEESE